MCSTTLSENLVPDESVTDRSSFCSWIHYGGNGVIYLQVSSTISFGIFIVIWRLFVSLTEASKQVEGAKGRGVGDSVSPVPSIFFF